MALKFFNVKLEIFDKEVPILADSIENLKGKVILLDTTRELKGKASEAKFKVNIENSQPIGKIVYFALNQNFARRLVRVGSSGIEDSFVATSKDNEKLRIKPLLATRKKVPRSIRKKIRENTRKILEEYVKSNERKKIFSSIISYELQKDMVKQLKKIYPLSVCEIRRIYVEK
jgi:ribosomal protein S3AE